MKGEVYGIAAFPVRESQCQAFHSINEIVSDMVEHLADSFDSNAALLKGCIIKDGTSVMLVGIHLMLLENGMEAKGVLVRSIRQSMRAFKSARYSVFFDTAQSP